MVPLPPWLYKHGDHQRGMRTRHAAAGNDLR
jgi:hypothetical protein